MEIEWTYKIEWIEENRKGFGEFSLIAGKELLALLKTTCGAYSYVTSPASGTPIIRTLSELSPRPRPTFGGKVTEL